MTGLFDARRRYIDQDAIDLGYEIQGSLNPQLSIGGCQHIAVRYDESPAADEDIDDDTDDRGERGEWPCSLTRLIR